MSKSDSEKTFLGQPRGLSTLFFTEMWERFSYYGMRAILLYFIMDSVANGGLDLPNSEANAIMSIYGSLVYMSSIIGGWLSDRIFGSQKTVLYGAFLIMVGHIVLATPFGLTSLFLSIALIVVGTGMLKPNVSGIVGQLYSPTDIRRDTGFSIFYMGINVGALLAPLIVGTIGQGVSYHLGFSIAAVGMFIGLVVYNVDRKKYFANLGTEPTNPLTNQEKKKFALTLGIVLVIICAIFGVAYAKNALTVGFIIDIISVLGILVPIYYFARMLTSKEVTREERSKIFAYIPLFISAIIFWSIEEQGSSILSTFAIERTRDSVMGIKIYASWFQTLNPLFIILLTPIFVKLWTKLGDRQPSTVVKFTLGLLLTGASYVFMALPGWLIGIHTRVSPLWLVIAFLIMMAGELCISPVGLSVTTKLAPKAFQSQTVAIWLLSDAASQAINAQLAKFFHASTEVAYFAICGGVTIFFGVMLFFIRKPIQKMMLDIK
ncbi:MAG: peptide MFS transporter [Lactobacillales bacterium]|jgi:POT family proton-dependent oligopeptide transporter|nr:peptide MFS transporter [Lactobacillales bacterium]